jgi:hypothetical protein
VKAATFAPALLVALLLLAPAPVSAAGRLNPERAAQPSALEQETTDEDASSDDTAAEAEATPTAEGEDGSGIASLHATAARLRGRVELGWSVNEGGSEGTFVVERSTNGSSWRPVKACSQPFDGGPADFGCTDTRLNSGTTYAYRVCITDKGTTCANASPSEPVTVKAP